MTAAPQLHPISHSAAVWQRYDPSVKADLWSTALRTQTGVYLVDPTDVDRASLADFVADSPILGIVITNENHLRDAVALSSALHTPLLSSSDFRAEDVRKIDLPGAPAGEIALIAASGELIVGDALINFEPYGFTLLPDKYCIDPKQMRASLRRLLDHEFRRIVFAHGTPIMQDARRRLASLLAVKDA